MILDQVLTMTLELLEHPEFKNFGDLQKSRYQNSKGEDELFLKSDLLKNTVSSQKGRKSKRHTKESYEKSAKTRKNWYSNPENRKKFMQKIKERDAKKKTND